MLAATATIQAADAPLVAAASSLRFALQEIVDRYVAETGQPLKISFGSSGNLTRQIISGAPFQIFLSADEDYVKKLEQRELVAESTVYAVGQLVLFVAAEAGVKADLADFIAAVGDGRINQAVIANPDRAPYGRAAREVLREAGLWEALQGRMVLGNNVSHAAQFLASGAVETGFIAYSLALSPELRAKGEFILLPGTERLLQAKMALLKEASEEAAAFYRYLLEPIAQSILQRHGFNTPQ
ncbi:MAG: molybdate ABC transporter substrate-binding protein [Pseudomonadota bacterium]|nr:molybdate ABC transporter substrate-binding protein [Pseudomonadota bacterium]